LITTSGSDVADCVLRQVLLKLLAEELAKDLPQSQDLPKAKGN
jgi:hypothetical protein